MACAGCSGYTGTLIAGVLGIVQTVFSMGWNVQLMYTMSRGNNSKHNLIPDILDNMSVQKANDFLAVYTISVIYFMLNVIWFVFACLLFKGNIVAYKIFLMPWCVMAVGMIDLQVILGVYFLWEYAEASSYGSRLQNLPANYFRLAASFSGWFFFWPIVNVFLIYFVSKRMKEPAIRRSSMFDTETRNTSRSRPSNSPPAYTESINNTAPVSVAQRAVQLYHRLVTNNTATSTGHTETQPTVDEHSIATSGQDNLLQNEQSSQQSVNITSITQSLDTNAISPSAQSCSVLLDQPNQLPSNILDEEIPPSPRY